jgi:hypothetical protein
VLGEFQHLLGNGGISEFPRRPTLGHQNAQRAVDPHNLKFRSAGVSFAAVNNLCITRDSWQHI